MELFKQFLSLSIVIISVPAMAQITSGKKEETVKEVPPVAKRVPSEGLDEFCFYVGAGRVYANRTLESNAEPFGEPLGIRADETGLKTWSFQAGMRNRVHRFVSYDAGFALDRFGESYSYDDPDSDSTFSYTSRYTYYAMPIQVLFTYGKDARFYVGGGLQPQLLGGYRQKTEWTTSLNGTGDSEIKKTDGLNGFGLAALVSFGVQLRFGKTTSVYVLPSFAWNLTDTYDKQADYIHKSHSFNLKFGALIHLPQGK